MGWGGGGGGLAGQTFRFDFHWQARETCKTGYQSQRFDFAGRRVKLVELVNRAGPSISLAGV